MRKVQAAGAYRGPLTVFWFDCNTLREEFGEGVDFLIGFSSGKFDKEKGNVGFLVIVFS